MPRPVLISLLVIFIIHLVIFSGLALIHKRPGHRMAAVTFALLAMGYALRIWWPEWQVGGLRAHIGLRRAAWITSAATLLLYLKEKTRSG